MKIALLRHARVQFKEPLFSTAVSFHQSRADYDDSPLEAPKVSISRDEFPRCYVSTMMRALTTAEMVYDGTPVTWPELVEVENTPFFLRWVPFPTVLRKIASRIAWFFNYRAMRETRRQSMERARHVIDGLLKGETVNTLLVTHGFFMRCLQHELHKFGFRGNIGISPNHAEVYVFET